MLTSLQRDLLISYIGWAQETNCLEIIHDSSLIDEGTKVLYLERAIKQDCDLFLKSLDKLYNPNLPEDQKKNTLDLIRAFKLINDFYFNNDIFYNQTDKKALDHYFGAIGTINLPDLQQEITSIIQKQSEKIKTNNSIMVQLQEEQRLSSEKEIFRQPAWRSELSLPASQRNVDIIELLGDLIPKEDYEKLSVPKRKLIAENTERTYLLMQKYGLTFDYIKKVEHPCEIEWLLTTWFEKIVFWDTQGICLTRLLEFDSATLYHLLHNAHPDTIKFLNTISLSLESFLELEYQLSCDLLANSAKTQHLICNIGIPLNTFLKLEHYWRNLLFLFSDEIKDIILLYEQQSDPLKEALHQYPQYEKEDFEELFSILEELIIPLISSTSDTSSPSYSSTSETIPAIQEREPEGPGLIF